MVEHWSMKLMFDLVGIAGMFLGAYSKVLLGNRSIWGWVMGFVAAGCWTTYSLHLGSWLMIFNNVLALGLVARGWCKWIRS